MPRLRRVPSDGGESGHGGGLTWQQRQVVYTLVTWCKRLTLPPCMSLQPPIPHLISPSPTSPSHSHHKPLNGEQSLTAGAALRFWPPIAPLPAFTTLAPSIPYPRHISLIFYSSLCYSQAARSSNLAIRVLVSAAPFSSAVTLSLSPRCPSAALTPRLFVSIRALKWAKMAHSHCWRGGQHVSF